MKRIFRLIWSMFNDGPIVGYSVYLKYRLSSSKEPMQVCVGSQHIWVRPGTPDLRVAFQSLRKELDILSELLPRDYDGLIVDAGGYIGTAALKLADMYPAALIVTIEPSSQNYSVLMRNIESNKSIVPINAALHSTSGRLFELSDRGTGAWGFSIVAGKNAVGDPIETVSTVSLEEIADRYPDKSIGILKMDIEGGEQVIFDSVSKTLSAIDAVFVELHDRIVPGCSDSFHEFCSNRWLLKAGGEKFLALRKQA